MTIPSVMPKDPYIASPVAIFIAGTTFYAVMGSCVLWAAKRLTRRLTD